MKRRFPVDPWEFIYPIVLLDRTESVEEVEQFCGTAFLASDNVVVTCWHCVGERPPEGKGYAVIAPNRHEPGWSAHHLESIAQHPGRIDLATAAIDLRLNPSLPLRLLQGGVRYGEPVWTFGFPLTEKLPAPGGDLRHVLHPRYFEGYIVRSFLYRPPAGGRIHSYELNFPSPEGLSGAPLMRRTETHAEIVGVLYGSNPAYTTVEQARRTPGTDDFEPEVRRYVEFGLAHHTDELGSTYGPATGGRTLAELLS